MGSDFLLPITKLTGQIFLFLIHFYPGHQVHYLGYPHDVSSVMRTEMSANTDKTFQNPKRLVFDVSSHMPFDPRPNTQYTSGTLENSSATDLSILPTDTMP